MKLSINSQAQPPNNSHRKVRLKCYRTPMMRRVVNINVLITIFICFVNRVNCNELRNNPPRFIIDDYHSEIVLRLKEGPETPVGKLTYCNFKKKKNINLFMYRLGSLIYTLKGYDPDGDALEVIDSGFKMFRKEIYLFNLI